MILKEWRREDECAQQEGSLLGEENTCWPISIVVILQLSGCDPGKQKLELPTFCSWANVALLYNWQKLLVLTLIYEYLSSILISMSNST